MKHLRQPAQRWLALVAAGQLLAVTLTAQDSSFPAAGAKSSSISASVASRPATKPVIRSPVDTFRQLLAMTPDERDVFLTNRPPEIRGRILAKLSEYEALNPNERALRLRATELRWYLIPLLHESPTNRAAQLARIPDDLREIVEARLEEWTILPPPLREEFLENEHLLSYFAEVNTGSRAANNSGREPSQTERAHWNRLPEDERRQVAAGFNQFFDLTAEEKEKTLNTLSETERAQMEKTLRSFENMPPAQRTECVNAFAKFASMAAPEKAEFLKNAERWSAMSPAERQAWRDLVVNVPQWPPLPIGFVVPIPGETNPVPNQN